MVIDELATDHDAEWSSSRIYSTTTRNTLRTLCTVNKFFESVAIRHLYTRVHLTSADQLAAFRKAIAYFGRPTDLARHVRTFSIFTTTHIASYQFAQDLVATLHVLRPRLEHLLLDVRRRHHFRQTSSSGGQDIGILNGGDTKATTAFNVFNSPWPRLIEVSISEGLDQYLRMTHLPWAFENVKRLALGHTAITTNTISRLLQMPHLEELLMVNSSVRWSDFERTSPTEPIAALMERSSSLRRLVWVVAPRPQWDMDETWSTQMAFSDAELLCSVPGVEVIYQPGDQCTDDILPDGLVGARFLGEGARSGLLWLHYS